MLEQNFVDWACSLSGCDGGNPDAPVWISGIEWGFEEQKGEEGSRERYYAVNLKKEIERGAFTPKDRYDWNHNNTYRFGKSVAKLYTAIKGLEVQNYLNEIKKFSENDLFKLNLYPIAFSNTDEKLWKDYKLAETTGFEHKYLFKTWCAQHRFPAISKIVAEKKPKLIIGVGVSYLTDFFLCFAGSSDVRSTIKQINITDRIKLYYAKLGCDTTLVVVPFFSSQSGLNSNDLLSQTGKEIRKIVGEI